MDVTNWMNLENSMLSGRNQSQKIHKLHDSIHMKERTVYRQKVDQLLLNAWGGRAE